MPLPAIAALATWAVFVTSLKHTLELPRFVRKHLAEKDIEDRISRKLRKAYDKRVITRDERCRWRERMRDAKIGGDCRDLSSHFVL